MHYGVPGMKWGVRRAIRRDDSVRTARKQYNKDFNAAAKAARKTKSFAITQRGKAKQAQRAQDYDKKYNQMMKSQQKLKTAESRVKTKIQKDFEKKSTGVVSEFAKERQRQKAYIAKKRGIQVANHIIQNASKNSVNSDSVTRLSNFGSNIAIHMLNRDYTRKTFE